MISDGYCNLNYILFIEISNLAHEISKATFLEKTKNLAFV